MSVLKPISQSLASLIGANNSLQVSEERDRKLNFAAERADLLFRSFPKAEADDPEVYAAAATAILAKYPDDVIIAVTDPADGLPVRQKWRPLLAELKAACEAEMAPMREAAARERRQAETERVLKGAETTRTQRPSYDDLKAKYGPRWGLSAEE